MECPTYQDVKAKYQDELNQIQIENDMAEEMLLANQKMELQELLDSLTDAQRYWFLQGWDKRGDVSAEFTQLSHEGLILGRTIYDKVNKELGINEADLIT